MGLGAGPGQLDGVRAVGQRLAAQPGGDPGGFAGRGRGGFGVAQAGQVTSVVEQSVGQVVGGAQLAQAADGGGKRRASVRVDAGGEAGAGQRVPFLWGSAALSLSCGVSGGLGLSRPGTGYPSPVGFRILMITSRLTQCHRSDLPAYGNSAPIRCSRSIGNNCDA
jgi:hypothetical protein